MKLGSHWPFNRIVNEELMTQNTISLIVMEEKPFLCKQDWRKSELTLS
jgi:hypothetical protein